MTDPYMVAAQVLRDHIYREIRTEAAYQEAMEDLRLLRRKWLVLYLHRRALFLAGE